MSFVIRPLNNIPAALEHYDAAGIFDYNGPFTVCYWQRGYLTQQGWTFAVTAVPNSNTLSTPWYGHTDIETVWRKHDSFDFASYSAGSAYGEMTFIAQWPWDNPAFPEFYWPPESQWNTPPPMADYNDELFATPWIGYPKTYYQPLSLWRHVAYSSDGTTRRVYVNGTLRGSHTPNIAVKTRSAAKSFTLGGAIRAGLLSAGPFLYDGTMFSDGCSGKFAYCRIFESALTAGQILAERSYTSAVETPWADWPLEADYNDISGNGRHLVEYAPAKVGPYPDDVYLFDADLPAGVTPSATIVGIPALAPIGVLLAGGVAVRGDPPIALTGAPHADPRLSGTGDAFARLAGAPLVGPRLSGAPRVFPRPIGGV